MHEANSNETPAGFAQGSLQDFIQALSAKAPTPGGGSVAALAGALAAAQLLMVIEYSVGKRSLAPHQPQLEDARSKMKRAASLFLEFLEEDAAAYEGLSAMLKLPADERYKQGNYAASITAAIRIPQAVAALANQILSECLALSGKTNALLESDLWVAADMAAASGQAAIRNVYVNLPLVQDADDRQREGDATAELAAHRSRLIASIKAPG